MNPNQPVSIAIGNRPLSLAAHLRHVGQLLTDQSVTYNWKKPQFCNCGLLARSITGLTGVQLRAHYDEMAQELPGTTTAQTAHWRQMAKAYCPLNPALKATDLFQLLRNAGLNQGDFAHLEFLSHPELRLDWANDKCYEERLNLIHYINAWATKIEEYHRAQSVVKPASLPPTEAQLEEVETRPLVAV